LLLNQLLLVSVHFFFGSFLEEFLATCFCLVGKEGVLGRVLVGIGHRFSIMYHGNLLGSNLNGVELMLHLFEIIQGHVVL